MPPAFGGTSTFQFGELSDPPHLLTLCQLPNVVGEKQNFQILLNLPVTEVPGCVSRSGKALEFCHLRLLGVTVQHKCRSLEGKAAQKVTLSAM